MYGHDLAPDRQAASTAMSTLLWSVDQRPLAYGFGGSICKRAALLAAPYVPVRVFGVSFQFLAFLIFAGTLVGSIVVARFGQQVGFNRSNDPLVWIILGRILELWTTP